LLLDLRHLGEDLIDRKLPFVRELARNYAGIDPVYEPIPVRPAVHYTMGGIHTDMNGRTPIVGLYACGEVACVSINGANRLGSNSLSECLVFGRRAGIDAATMALSKKEDSHSVGTSFLHSAGEYVHADGEKIYNLLKRERGEVRLAEIRDHLQSLMETQVGIFRDNAGLQDARRQIRELRMRLQRATIEDKGSAYNADIIQAYEIEFMLDVADAIAYSALMREESRGAHFRTDFPKRDDQRFLFHLLNYYSTDRPVTKNLEVSITKWQPAERKY